MSEEEINEKPLVGDELLEEYESLMKDELSHLQERVYSTGYIKDGEPDYLGYFIALASARNEDFDVYELESYDQFEIPYLALEIGKIIKLERFYENIISNLINKNVNIFEAYAVIKKLELKVNFKDKYKSGYITDYIDLNKVNKDEKLYSRELINKITNDKNELVYSPTMILECGYKKYDDDGNENPSVIDFLEEVIKEKKVNIDEIDITFIDLISLVKELEFELNNLWKPYAIGAVIWDNSDDLDAYYLYKSITLLIEIVDPSELKISQKDNSQQEFQIVRSNEDKHFGLMPSGEYLIGECPFGVEESIDEYSPLLLDKGPVSSKKGETFILITTSYGDGEYLDNKNNSYPIGGGAIPCVSSALIEEEDAGDYSDSINLHKFNEPLECNWFKNGGYIQYGDIWIQTDEFDNFFIPTIANTALGKAALEYGKKFIKTSKSSSDKESEASYWWQLYNDVETGDVIDKTVKQIYSEKYLLATNESDSIQVYEKIVSNYGLNRSAEAFYRIFVDQSELDEEEIEEKLLLHLDKTDPKQIEVPEIPKFSSLNLENDPQVVEAKLEARISSFLSEVGSKFRKELWPEGQVASDYWNEIVTTKKKKGDQVYAEFSTLMAKLHMREMSGDAVFTAGQKFEDKERYRIYKDMADNCKWFVQINQSEEED